MSPNTILVLGAGPRVGWSVAQKFKAEGYQVAVASRKPDVKAATKAGFLPITVDLSSIPSVEAAFFQVTKELGVPNVVVYNGASSPSLMSSRHCLIHPFLTPQIFFVSINLTIDHTAAAITRPKDLTDPFSSVSPEAFVNDNNVTLLGTYVAIKEAVAGFHTLSPETPKAFIVTGNILPWKPSPTGVTLGTGKAGAAHLVEIGALAYKDKHFRSVETLT
jgi:NAD(P)-dependent dehydrogenase (short-subunit alcohol dehydrogenase family)